MSECLRNQNPPPPAMAKAAMAEVEILETNLVYPSLSPVSDFRQDRYDILPLSHIDTDPNLHVTFRTLRVYANPNASSHPDPYDAITQALSKALVHFYPIAGTLRRRQTDSRLELHCAAGQGVPVTRASSYKTLASLDYLDDPGLQLLDRLAPDPGSGEELDHPLAFQVTGFACGGFSLGMCVHHSLCDGAGATLFLGALAAIARGADGPTVTPVWDRSDLLGPRGPPRVKVDFFEFLGFGRDAADPCDKERAVVRECFHMSESSLERFKAQLSEESGSNFTTFEALGAFIWQARIKASRFPCNTKVKFAYSMNIRKVVKPPLPNGYWGNSCVPVYVQLTAEELMEKPVSAIAELIKKSKHNVTDEYVRSFIDFQELHHADGITAGDWVSGFTDWRHLGHSSVDFGWGGPVTVLPLSFKLLGSVEPCFFLPYSSVGGVKKDGFKVLVSMSPRALPAFKLEMEFFKNDGDKVIETLSV